MTMALDKKQCETLVLAVSMVWALAFLATVRPEYFTTVIMVAGSVTLVVLAPFSHAILATVGIRLVDDPAKLRKLRLWSLLMLGAGAAICVKSIVF